MQVKCIKIFNNQDEEQASSSWLTIGKTYIVLEILCDVDKGFSYRLVDDSQDKSPGVYKAFQFEIVTDIQPSNWAIKISKDGYIDIAPKSWHEREFWESCFDGDEKSLEIYKKEARIIYTEEGIDLPGH